MGTHTVGREQCEVGRAELGWREELTPES